MNKRDHLVLEHVWLVRHIAHRYRRGVAPMDDLIQEGMLGLVIAARSYDESKAKFSTHAYYVVWGKLTTLYRRERVHAGIHGSETEKKQRKTLMRVYDDGEEDAIHRISDESPSPETVVMDREQREQLQRALRLALRCSGPLRNERRAAQGATSVSQIATRLHAMTRKDARKLQAIQSII